MHKHCLGCVRKANKMSFVYYERGHWFFNRFIGEWGWGGAAFLTNWFGVRHQFFDSQKSKYFLSYPPPHLTVNYEGFLMLLVLLVCFRPEVRILWLSRSHQSVDSARQLQVVTAFQVSPAYIVHIKINLSFEVGALNWTLICANSQSKTYLHL